MLAPHTRSAVFGGNAYIDGKSVDQIKSEITANAYNRINTGGAATDRPGPPGIAGIPGLNAGGTPAGAPSFDDIMAKVTQGLKAGLDAGVSAGLKAGLSGGDPGNAMMPDFPSAGRPAPGIPNIPGTAPAPAPAVSPQMPDFPNMPDRSIPGVTSMPSPDLPTPGDIPDQPALGPVSRPAPGAPAEPDMVAGPSPAPSSGGVGAPSGQIPGDLNITSGVQWDSVNQYDDIINSEAAKNGVDPAMIKSMMVIESGGVSGIANKNGSGASGLMQIKPLWADEAASLGYDLNTDEGQIGMASAIIGGKTNATRGMDPQTAFTSVYYPTECLDCPGEDGATPRQYLNDIASLTQIINESGGGRGGGDMQAYESTGGTVFPGPGGMPGQASQPPFQSGVPIQPTRLFPGPGGMPGQSGSAPQPPDPRITPFPGATTPGSVGTQHGMPVPSGMNNIPTRGAPPAGMPPPGMPPGFGTPGPPAWSQNPGLMDIMNRVFGAHGMDVPIPDGVFANGSTLQRPGAPNVPGMATANRPGSVGTQHGLPVPGQQAPPPLGINTQNVPGMGTAMGVPPGGVPPGRINTQNVPGMGTAMGVPPGGAPVAPGGQPASPAGAQPIPGAPTGPGTVQNPSGQAIDVPIATGQLVPIDSPSGWGVEAAPGSDDTWVSEATGGGGTSGDYGGDTTAYNPDGSWYVYQEGHGGDRYHHMGQDIVCGSGDCYGSPVTNVLPGKVICSSNGSCDGTEYETGGYYSEDNGGAGTVTIQYANNSDIQVSYGHLSSSNVGLGQNLQGGEVVGGMGMEGTGVHTHVSATGRCGDNWIYLDPTLVMDGYYDDNPIC